MARKTSVNLAAAWEQFVEQYGLEVAETPSAVSQAIAAQDQAAVAFLNDLMEGSPGEFTMTLNRVSEGNGKRRPKYEGEIEGPDGVAPITDRFYSPIDLGAQIEVTVRVLG